ncbi:MAG: ABC transporter permease [Gemmatimonas sp.]|uniref:ABC transporter permease n=1 Tax=Gemmatimonas sp. TaxID=1962908 RepID=UPI00391FA1AF
MIYGEVMRVALGALRANKLRSVLTMLGIVIGVGAVIAMDGIGRGAQESIKTRITALGTTLLTVTPGQIRGMGGVAAEADRARLTMDDAAALEEQAALVTAVQPEMSRQLQIQFASKNASTQVVGTSANYLEVRKYELLGGRMFTTQEDVGKQRLAVLGPAVLQNLGIENPDAIIGEQIRLRGIQFTVIGVLKSKGQTSPFQNPDDQVLIPLNTARFRVLGTDRIRSISVLAVSEARIPESMAEIQKILRREHRLPRERDDDFTIRNQADFLTTFAETSKVFGSLLAGIAAVSLVVGGIGIMNLMLVSVTERTREIGVRKALGATKGNILMQFLIEAIVLCLVGGAIGIAVGSGGAMVLSRAFQWNTAISSQSVLLAFLFSAAVGLIFGVWPARRAARLDPIQALRYE